MAGIKKSVNEHRDTADLTDDDLSANADVEDADRRKRQNMLIMMLTTSIASLGNGLFFTTYSQWIYVRFEHEVLGANFSKMTQTAAVDPCFRGNRTDSPFKAQLVEAQAASARFNVLLMVCTLVPSIFVNMVLGAYADQIGRRLIFIAPMTGSVFRSLVTCCVAYWELDHNILLLGAVINGLSGDFLAFIMAMYVYTADNTSRGKNRSFFMVFATAVMSMSHYVTLFASGYFITSVGYVWPMVTGLAGMILGLILSIFFIRETLDKTKVERKNLCQAVRGVFSFYFEKPENPMYKRSDFILLGLIFFVYTLSFGGSITTMYLMNEPFCWGSKQQGYVNSVFGLGHAVLSMILMRLLQMIISDELVCIFSLLASVVHRLLFAFANYDWQIYAAYAAAAVEAPIMSVIRAILSRMVHPNRRGSIFASIAVVESVTIAASGAGLNELYAATVGEWRGLTFFVIACITLTSAVLFIIYKIIISLRQAAEVTLAVEKAEDGLAVDNNYHKTIDDMNDEVKMMDVEKKSTRRPSLEF